MKSCDLEVGGKGFVLYWTEDDGMFGQFSFWIDENCNWHYDSETLSDEKVVEAFQCFLKQCKGEKYL